MSIGLLRRRQFLGTTAAAGAASLVYPAKGTFAASEKPVVVGMVDSLTGTYSALGRNEVLGARLALKHINANGGILGRPIALKVEDDGTTPGLAVQKARKLVHNEGATFLMGAISSAVALAVSQTSEDMKTLYVDTGGHADPVTGTRCNWTTFRTCLTTWMLTGNFGTLFKKFGKKWFFITPDYAYGHSLFHDYQSKIVKAGGKVLGNMLAPLGATDFSSYLIHAKAAHPDVLMVLSSGEDLVNCMKQAIQFGIQKDMTIAGSLGELEDFAAMPEVARIGWWVFEWWWDQPNQPGLTQFIGEYKKIAGGKYPSARSWFGWVTLHAIAAAANKAKSLDTLKVVHGLEGLELPPEIILAPNNPVYRKGDHQLIANAYSGHMVPDGKYPNLFKVVDVIPGASIARSVADSGCKMKYPA